jgi:cytoplasmic iron level regulating protein YaaA (DUF328/UPF0246 family)
MPCKSSFGTLFLIKKRIMKIVISPAKSLDYKKPLPTNQCTQPYFLEQATRINGLLKEKSPQELSSLMGISEKLADLNWARNQSFSVPFSPKNARQAIYAFNGDVYSGLDAYSLNEEQWQSMQQQLRILSGLYGMLKPLDLMQPYRLEMGTRFAVGDSKNLHTFWKPLVTKQLNDELSENELFVNLASNEYFSAVDSKALKTSVITPIFKDYKNGKLKVISFFAKKARGLMVRYILDHNSKTLDDLLGFDRDGYAYSQPDTVNPLQPVFVR